MDTHISIQLAAFFVLGMGAQWIAWRLRLPSILLLLLTGFLAGPFLEWLGHDKLVDPDALFGKLLVPLVSLAVSVVLFEGGLSLNFSELAHGGRVIASLVTVGGLVTWLVTTIAARLILGFEWGLSILIGSILMVTGPTVIGPLLRHVRPSGRIGPILKWEGVVIDPIGAMLTVLVFEAMPKGSVGEATAALALGVGKIVVVGAVFGAVAARIWSIALRRFWAPDYLQNPITLALVVGVFTTANLVAGESGLVAVTVMGILLGNQRQANVGHIAEFKESLVVLLISGLFILLAARLDIRQIEAASLPTLAFTAVLILLARPLTVLVSTIRSGLSWRERLFLGWMAPRGIVAASVASLFALRLRELNYPGAENLVPVTFTVIVLTVTIYGLTASWLSRRLKLSVPSPGFLIAGANPVAREIAAALQAEGQDVLMVDSNFDEVQKARLAGLPVLYGSVLSQFVQQKIELTNIGRLLALTSNAEANSLAAMKFARIFGREHVFQLAPEEDDRHRLARVGRELQGRTLFAPGVTFGSLEARLAGGDVLKRSALTTAYTYADYRAFYGETALPLFTGDATGRLEPTVESEPVAPQPDQVLISLVRPASAPAPVETGAASV